MKVVTSMDQLSVEEMISWQGKPYAIDVETTGLDYMHDELIGVALFVNETPYYFVLKHSTGDGSVVADYLSINEVRLILNPVMSQNDCVACLHNSKFDLHYFERYRMPLASRNFDTLIAAKLLDEDRNNGLKSLTKLVNEDHAKYETMVVYDAFPKGSPLNVPLKEFADYAMKDVIVTYKLWQLFRKDLAKDTFRGRSMQDVFNEVWMPMIPTLREMESWGFKIDLDRTKELLAEYEPKLVELRAEVRKEGLRMLLDKLRTQAPETLAAAHWQMLEPDDHPYEVDGKMYLEIDGIETPLWQPTERSKFRKLDFNLASSNQMIELVYERPLAIPDDVQLVTTKKGEDSVSVDNLKVIKYYLGEDSPHYIDVTLEWRKLDKYVNTYLRMFVEKVDEKNRLHGLFNMAASETGKGGTRTGRLSSSNPNLNCRAAYE